MKCKGSLVCILSLASCITATACAPRRVALPTDTGTPFPDFAAVHQQVSSSCRDVRTFEALLSLRGQVGQERLSGRARAGFERPSSMRLEGLAPIGQPLFILTHKVVMESLLCLAPRAFSVASPPRPFSKGSSASTCRPAICRPS